MSSINKIILAIIIIIAIAAIYNYMQPGYNPYPTPTPSPSPFASATPSPSPTSTPLITSTPSPIQSPKISPTPSPKPSPSPTATPRLSATPTPTATPVPTPTPKIDVFNISAVEFSYSPNSITVKSGDTVKINFSNNGGYSHNLTIEGLNIATQTINPGQTDIIQFTAPAPGTYNFFCSVDLHRDLGLRGTLIVQ